MPLEDRSRDIASTLEGLLSAYTRGIMSDSFGQDLFGRLPTEIQFMIADLVSPCRYLIVLGETRRLMGQIRNDCKVQHEQLSLKQDFYITWRRFQGNFYISKISNIPLKGPGSPDHKRLELSRRIEKLVISVDHIGIRQVQFVGQGSNPSRDDSPWYKVCAVQHSQKEVYAGHYGLFVRTIWSPPDDPNKLTTWSSPCPPEFNPWNVYLTQGYKVHPYLHHMKLNAETQGLVVCCCAASMVGIHAFSGPSNEFKAFVKSANQHSKLGKAFWLYFPINIGELITAAWVRRSQGGMTVSPDLIIETSLGRTRTFGPHLPSFFRNSYFDYLPLVKKGDGIITGIFHDGLDQQTPFITTIGVTCENETHAQKQEVTLVGPNPPGQPEPPLGPFSNLPDFGWYMTKAPLPGLSKVRVCRDCSKPHQPCLGLLLYYDDGHVESLGQIRWDCDLAHEVLAPICIGSSDWKQYIKDVREDANCTEDVSQDTIWQRLPQSGTIYWWFSCSGDVITIQNS